jgi:hypothetical protein
MPLPLFIGIGVAVATAFGVGAAVGDDEGYDRGYSEGSELSTAERADLKRKLQRILEERERTKREFQNLISEICTADIRDSTFARFGALFRGYTKFHVFVLTCLSYCKYQVLSAKIRHDDAEELKNLVLGIVSAGFPQNLKNDIRNIWDSENINNVITAFHECKGKLGKNLQNELNNALNSINDYVKQFAAEMNQVHEIESRVS